jgi:hypothetical protein
VIEKGSIDRRGKGFMIEIHMCVKVAQWNSLKLKMKGKVGGVRKSNIDGVNLIKVHYMHVCKYCNEIIIQLIYDNKTLKIRRSRPHSNHFPANDIILFFYGWIILHWVYIDHILKILFIGCWAPRLIT